jgi:hypothetical protein
VEEQHVEGEKRMDERGKMEGIHCHMVLMIDLIHFLSST